MTPDPIASRPDAPARGAAALPVDQGFTGAPAIDGPGRPVGAVTQTDARVRDRGKAGDAPRVPEDHTRSGERGRAAGGWPRSGTSGCCGSGAA
jgi:CBS domain-containing protein